MAYAEVSGTPLCILSIDFTEAFDRISHDYLFELLRKHGFSERFRQRLRNIYSNATSAIQINGFRSKPIPINCAVRQGCPLSMVLYAFCLNPLLCTLDKHLTGLSMGRRHVRTSVIAYADDVTILVTSPSDIPKIQDALRCYEEATGAKSEHWEIAGDSNRILGCLTPDHGHPVPRRSQNIGAPHHDNGTGLGHSELDIDHCTNTRICPGSILSEFEFGQEGTICT